MKPKPSVPAVQPDLFQTELKAIINLHHPLVKLANQFNWDAFEQQLQPTYAPVMVAPGINTRLMVALHFLKHQHDLSDDEVVAKWVENPYWQFFNGMQFSPSGPHRLLKHEPVENSSWAKWRRIAAQRNDLSRPENSGHQAFRFVSGQCGYNGSDQGHSVSNRCASL